MKDPDFLARQDYTGPNKIYINVTSRNRTTDSENDPNGDGSHEWVTEVSFDIWAENLTKIIESYVASSPERLCMSVSLGQLRYFSAMKYASAVVGNSSSWLTRRSHSDCSADGP